LDLCLHLSRQHAGPADANHAIRPTIAWMEENVLAALDLQPSQTTRQSAFER